MVVDGVMVCMCGWGDVDVMMCIVCGWVGDVDM